MGAYVFIRFRMGWQEPQQLTASDGDSGDAFGAAVMVDHDTMAIGAPHGDVQEEFSPGPVIHSVR